MCMQKIGVHSIEDCLEVLTGLQSHSLTFKISSNDNAIVNSIARQVFRGTALTDRQYALMKEKLLAYKEQFESQDIIGFDRALNKLRNPIRAINRDKSITISSGPADTPVLADHGGKFIKVRFPFKKSDIALIEEINKTKDYYHKKGTHEHYFAFNEANVFNVLSRFVDKNYYIDQELKDVYNRMQEIKTREQDYVPGIYHGVIKNLHPRAKEFAEAELGEYNSSTALLYVDRRHRYGIVKVDAFTPNSIEEKIAYRDDLAYQSKPSEESFSNILEALVNLKRMPLLVILEKENAEHQLREWAEFSKGFMSSESQSVLFRQEGDSSFNTLVKDRKLNNWVDTNTKIVYISNDKLPKLLIKNEWRPIATFSYTSKLDRAVDSYAYNRCDLIVYREEMLSPMRRYSQYYGHL